MHGGNHLWSLGVEVQFYAAIALVILISGRRGLLLAPVGAVAITIARILSHETISIVTWHRGDEILAGATLALLVYRTNLPGHLSRLPAMTPVILLALLLISSLPGAGAFAYLRPYIGAATVGTSLFAAPRAMQLLWCSASARYIANISYALYVIHGILSASWLGSGERSVKYLKRPLLLATTFALAHLSTYRFESRFIAIGKRLTGPAGNSKT
jgi:peptidoglycan/LPS O-acetylase OafA/YrhL